MSRSLLMDVFWGLFVSAISFTPFLLESSFSDTNLPELVLWLLGGIGIFYVPGIFLSMILKGNLHEPNMGIAFGLNCGLYATIFHFFRRWRSKRAL